MQNKNGRGVLYQYVLVRNQKVLGLYLSAENTFSFEEKTGTKKSFCVSANRGIFECDCFKRPNGIIKRITYGIGGSIVHYSTISFFHLNFHPFKYIQKTIVIPMLERTR